MRTSYLLPRIGRQLTIAILAMCAGAVMAPAQASDCVNIYHDEVAEGEATGPINAIMLANLLGHWPHYELRSRPIGSYKTADLDACKATIYLGTSQDTDVPDQFLADFFSSSRRIAWVGFGQHQLDKRKFETSFEHAVSGEVGVDNPKSKKPAFFQYVSYKDQLFKKSVDLIDGKPDGAFTAVRFVPTRETSKNRVLANLIHNTSRQMSPYMLRDGTKFIVGDIPFSYMHEGDRYFAFADLLFDILDEQPTRTIPVAFARTEDIHGSYETDLVEATLEAHKSEDVPYSVAHIPLFADPFDAFGTGKVSTPKPAHEQPNFLKLIQKIRSNDRNTVVWHGVTHQFGSQKNPHSGTSGDDYEFWDMVANKPIGENTPDWTLNRLSQAMPVFEAYGAPPRFWVTPHYHASAVDARVFSEVMPWHIGRVTYYPSSFGPTFTIPAADRTKGVAMPAVTKSVLDGLKGKITAEIDRKSENGLTQMFPFEIFRDVYGQRIVPETLGYMSYATTDQTAFLRSADDLLADARRNTVVRDYWASFFYHPYIFSSKEDGGIGRFKGDTIELRKLFVGLKLLGYNFISLPEFEKSLLPPGKLGAVSQPSPSPN